jgi:hypothetical protein
MKRYGEFTVCPNGKPISEVLNNLFGHKSDVEVVGLSPTTPMCSEYIVVTVQTVPDQQAAASPEGQVTDADKLRATRKVAKAMYETVKHLSIRADAANRLALLDSILEDLECDPSSHQFQLAMETIQQI